MFCQRFKYVFRVYGRDGEGAVIVDCTDFVRWDLLSVLSYDT